MKYNKEDSLMFALRMGGDKSSVEKVLKDAEAIRDWMSDDKDPRPEWSEVSKYADVVAERDRARDLAARLEQELAQMEARFFAAEHEIDRRGDKVDRLEQENADLESKLEEVALISAKTQQALLEATQSLEEVRGHLTRGVLSTALRIATSDPELSGIRVVQLTANRFGVTL